MTDFPIRADIYAAKERVRIPELWSLLNFPGEPKRFCRSPFRNEKRASFSIFDEGRRAKDHGTGENFDGPGFLAKALGLPIGEALERFVATAGAPFGCIAVSPQNSRSYFYDTETHPRTN